MAGPKGAQTPSHVLYADDVMVFCKGTKKNLSNLMSIFKEYGEASGHYLSIEKCRFYSGSMSVIRDKETWDLLGFSAGSFPFIYLGVPIFKRKAESDAFSTYYR